MLLKLVCVFFLIFFSGCFELTSNQSSNNDFVFVERIIDGDTFKIPTNKSVRLIGIDTPEKGEKCYYESTVLLKKLIDTKQVKLVKDVSDKDKYNRLLRYVYLIDGNFINLQMVQEGFAYAKKFEPDTTFAKSFKKAELSAKLSKKGCLWKREQN